MILLGKHITYRRVLTCQVRRVESPVEVACLCQPVIQSGGGQSTVLQTPGCATTYSIKRKNQDKASDTVL